MATKAKAKASSPFKVGACYLIRTVTYHQVGRVIEIGERFLVLDGASWVSDSGRFGVALATGTLSEVEFAGDGVLVGLDAICDAYPWRHALPTESK